MNGNSKDVIFRKADNALNLAEIAKKFGDVETEKIWRDEYDKRIKQWLNIR